MAEQRTPRPVAGTTAAGLSRRGALRRFGAALVGLLAAPVGAVAAQEIAPPAVTVDVPPVVLAWIDAQNAHDLAAHAILYGDESVMEDVPNGSPVRGEQIEGFVANVSEGFADIRVDVRSMAGGPGWAVVEYDFSATNRGLIPVPGALGKSCTVPTATVIEVAGETIRRSSDDHDLSAIQRQFGLAPSPGEGGAPMATPAA